MPSPAAWLVALTTACVSIPDATGIRSSGEPLRVTNSVFTVGETVAKRVGTATTDTGQTAGIYELEHHENYVSSTWYAYQGSAALDDDDFFRIAGDRDALDALRSQRRTIRWVDRGAVLALALGLAASLFGATHTDSTAGNVMLATGVASSTIGSFALIWAVYETTGDRAQSMGFDHALEIANRYNAGLAAP